jgi:hypothetical protein
MEYLEMHSLDSLGIDEPLLAFTRCRLTLLNKTIKSPRSWQYNYVSDFATLMLGL